MQVALTETDIVLRYILAAALGVTVILTGQPNARAAGWQGGDHSILRDGFAPGKSLRRLWTRLDDR